MIDLMNQKTKAQAYTSPFTLLPKGKYTAKVASIDEWKPKDNATLKVFKFDERGRKVQDENGKDVFTVEKNVRTYSARVTFEIIGGEYDGATIFHYLNLHPNQPWGLPAFLDACRVEELDPKDVKRYCVGAIVNLYIDVELRDYETTDKETGLTNVEKRERNTVKSVTKASLEY